MVDSRYRTSTGCVFTLKYHLFWCPKYRLKVLTGEVAERLRKLLYTRAEENNIVIEALEITPALLTQSVRTSVAGVARESDHVNLFVSADPTEAPQRNANPFKGCTSPILRKEFAHLRSRMPALWSRSYFVGSVGYVCEETIKKYIESQETRY